MDRAGGRVRVLASHLDPVGLRKPLATPPSGWEVEVVPARAAQNANASTSGTHGPARPRRPAFLTAQEAVAGIKDGSWLVVSGFVGLGYPAELVDALRSRFDTTATPRSLGLLVVAAVGDGKGGGLGRLAVPGLLTRLIYAWTGLSPEFAALIDDPAGGLEAHNLPLGVVSHMIRDVGAGRPGPVTRIGLGTFVDPLHGGGKRGPPAARAAARDVVRRVTFPPPTPGAAPRTLLHYTPPPSIDVALLRGTTADTDGNIAFDREALPLDALTQAMAAHNSPGGKVMVQVARVVPVGSLPPRSVIIPGVLVDVVVVVPGPPPTLAFGMPDPDGVAALCGGVGRTGDGGEGGKSTHHHHHLALPTGVRRIVARRAMLALGELCTPHSLVNIGVGMAEGVAACVAGLGKVDIPSSLPLVLSTEAGAIGGAPAGGRLFGASAGAAAHIPTPSMLDLYNGGAVAAAVLGLAQVSASGDVNVSSFPGRSPGCGGFIDISQSARAVVFVGTFTSGGLKVEVAKSAQGKPSLRIVREGRHAKFAASVVEKTFAGESGGGRPVLYVTERAVFRLVESAGRPELELIEVAPGVDLQRDVLGRMGFVPRVAEPLGVMDGRCFE